MISKKITALSVIAAASMAASVASAATFTFDASDPNSTLALTQTGGGCVFAACDLTASYVGDYSMDVVSGSATETVDNFIEWDIEGTPTWWGTDIVGLGGKSYNVSATLHFSSPTPGGTSGSNDGEAAFLTVGGLLGAGGLTWDNGGVGTVYFDNGYRITYDLHDGFTAGVGSKAYSGVTFTAAVPVPAAGLLLVGALGGLGALRRRKKAA